MWIFQLKFIPIVYKELIIHRIKKEFNHKELLVLLVMGCSLPLLGGTGACYRYIFTNIAKIQRLFHWSYDAYISTMLHIRMDNFQ